MPGTKRPVGRPAKVDGKRVQVYLDAESITIATRLGNGNVSEGIRKALKTFPAQEGHLEALDLMTLRRTPGRPG